MQGRLSVRWLVGVVAMAGVLVVGWALWPSGHTAEHGMGWQVQSDLPMLVYGPRGVAVGRNGDVYVVDSGYVQRLRAGQFIPERLPVPGLEYPYAVVVGPADELYVSDYHSRRVVRVSADRQTIAALPFFDVSEASSALDNGVAVDRSGTVFVTDPDKSRILKLAAGAQAVEVLATVEHLRGPIAVSDTGDLVVLVSDPVPTLLTFRGGKTPAVPTAIPDLEFVSAITIDHHGNRLLADNALEFKTVDGELRSTRTTALWRLTPEAVTPERLPYTDLGAVAGITVDASDTIFYTDSTALGRVVRLSS